MIELENLSKIFGQTKALDNVSLTMPEGSFTSLLGPSGCGKSTMLRIIAGLDQPSSGQVRINGRDVTELTAAERNIAMVFQSYALYPHLSVRGNITLPLTMRNMNRIERMPFLDHILPSARRKIAEHAAQTQRVAEMLEIDQLLDRKPSELSGGQKQRVAVGRALVRDPIVFLFDEPLSNLDAKLRTQMRSEIVDLHQRTRRTFIYVTHDQAEAMSMSDNIAVIMGGRILQVASPRDLFERPVNVDVAAFLGDRPINLIELSTAEGRLPPPFDGFACDVAELPGRVIIGLRPETLEPDEQGPLTGTVGEMEYLGSEAMVSLHLDGGHQLRAALNASGVLPKPGETLRLGVEHGIAHVFDAATGRRLGGLSGAAKAGAGIKGEGA